MSAAALVYLIGNARVGLWDRDEPRYAQTSRQMLQSGDWVVPRFLDTVRTAKPAGIYWCQATAMALLGDTAYAARLPSVIALLATTLLLARFVAHVAGRRSGGWRRGCWCAFVLASSGLSIAAAKMSLTDGVLLLFITGSQMCLYALWRGRRGAWVFALLGVCVGCGGLIKGPVALGVNATTLGVLWASIAIDRRRGRGTTRARLAACGNEQSTAGCEKSVDGVEGPLGGGHGATRGGEGSTAGGEGSAGGSAASAGGDEDVFGSIEGARGFGVDQTGDGTPLRVEAAATQAGRKPMAGRVAVRVAGRGAGGVSVSLPAGCAIAAVIVGLLVVPWLVLVERRAPGFLSTAISHDVVDRARSGQEGHAGPPGYYLVTIWGTFFPWSLILPAALVTAWRHRRVPLLRFALAAVIGPWVMFEGVAGKLPHYILPTFPFLAVITADLLLRAGRGSTAYLRDRLAAVVGVAWGAGVALAGVGPFVAIRSLGPVTSQGVIGAALTSVALVATGGAAGYAFHRRLPLRAARAMGAGTFAIIFFAYGVMIPGMPALRLAQRTGAALRAAGATGPNAGVMIDYKEPSMAFYQGGTLVEEDASDYLQQTPPANWPRWVVITRDVWGTTPPATRRQWEIVATETGLQINGGKWREVLVLRRRE